MKSFIISTVLAALLVTFVITVSVSTASVCDEMYDKVKDAPASDGTSDTLENELEYFTDLSERWQECKKIINLSINHQKTEIVDQNFANVIGACEANDYKQYKICVSATADSIDAVRGLCKCSLDNII